MESYFGKKMSPAKKAMKLRYKKNISLKEAWDEVLGRKPTKSPKTSKVSKTEKVTFSKLNQLSLKKLSEIAMGCKVSTVKKSDGKKVKKSTLINRLLKCPNQKKLSALVLKSSNKKAKFGNTSLNLLPRNNRPQMSKPGIPQLNSWSDISMGNTQAARNKHYKSLPSTFLSFNRVDNQKYSIGGLRPSMAPYGLTSNQFGQYFQ